MRRLSLILLAVHASALPARGEESELPPVVVPAPAPTIDTPDAPARRDPTAAISEVTRPPATSEVKSTADWLAPAPGLVVHDVGGFGQRQNLSVRGASPNAVLVFLDGVPLNPAGGNVDLSRVPAAALEAAQVQRGGAGARYGSGGLGGAVYLSTRRARDGARAFAEASYGSFRTGLLHAGATGALLGGEGLVLLHGGQSAGDFSFAHDAQPNLEGNPLSTVRRQNNQAAHGGALLKFRRALAGAWQGEALLEANADDRGLAGTAANPTLESRQRGERVLGAARVERSLSPAGALSFLAFGQRDALALHSLTSLGSHRQTTQSVGVDATYAQLFAERHGVSATLLVAGDSLFEPTEVNPGWVRFAVMAADEVLFAGGAFALTPSLRFDRTGPFNGISPKLGAALQLPAGFELKANAGQAHRAPSFLELYVVQGSLLPNPQLRPERALFADVAVAHRTERTRVSVGGFYSLYEDLISYEYYPPLLARPYNFATARVSGLEAEARLEPTHWLGATGSYTYLSSQNLKDDPRYYLKTLPYRPRHKVAARLELGPSTLRGHAELLFQSRQFTNRTETLFLEERAFVNVGLVATVTRRPELQVAGELKNLLDVQSQDLDGYPLPGRAAYVTAAVAWDFASSPSPASRKDVLR